jgi:hypothetical protein
LRNYCYRLELGFQQIPHRKPFPKAEKKQKGVDKAATFPWKKGGLKIVFNKETKNKALLPI